MAKKKKKSFSDEPETLETAEGLENPEVAESEVEAAEGEPCAQVAEAPQSVEDVPGKFKKFFRKGN